MKYNIGQRVRVIPNLEERPYLVGMNYSPSSFGVASSMLAYANTTQIISAKNTHNGQYKLEGIEYWAWCDAMLSPIEPIIKRRIKKEIK